MTQGLFISFEGGEGSGKSTQIRLLADHLSTRGHITLVTREPGGTPQGEVLRDVMLKGCIESWSAEAEALLAYAARDAHLTQLIRPALARGEMVLCDRFSDSTRAYQGYGGGCSFSLLDQLEQAIVGATQPAITFLLAIDPAIGRERARLRAPCQGDRFEGRPAGFHQRLAQGFLEIAHKNPKRCHIIDAAGDVETVAGRIRKVWDEGGYGR